MGQPQDFFETLYGNEYPGALVLWKKGLGARRFPSLPDEDSVAPEDQYYGVALQPSSGEGRGQNLSAIAIPGVWCDLDVGSHGNAKRYLPDAAAAEAFLRSFGALTPNYLVWTGGGFHAYWLFRELWIFKDSNERDRAARLVEKWQRHIRDLLDAIGHEMDSTFDLARVLRVPGTLNTKYDEEVSVQWDETSDRRWTWAEFEALCPEAKVLSTPGDSADVVPTDGITGDDPRLQELFRLDSQARATWFRDRRDLKDSSPSGYDMALASILAGSEAFSPQEVTELLIACRRMHGDDLKHPRYWRLTVGRAFGTQRRERYRREKQEKLESATQELEDAVDDLRIAREEEPDKEAERIKAARDKVREVLPMLPEDWQLVRHPGDEVSWRLRGGGSSVTIRGGSRQVMSFAGLQAAVIDLCKVVIQVDGEGKPGQLRRLYEVAVTAMIETAIDEEVDGSDQEEQVREWIQAYLTSKGKPLPAETLSDAPYRTLRSEVLALDDGLYVHLDGLLTFVNSSTSARHQKLVGRTLGAKLRQAGFEAVRLRLGKDKVQARYWRVVDAEGREL